MSKKLLSVFGILVFLAIVLTPVIMAAEEKAAVKTADPGSMWYFALSVVGAGLSLAIAAFAGAFAQGNAVAKAVEGIARQPEATGQIQTVLIIGLAFIESLTIYALVVALILIFVNPFAAYFVH